MEIQLKAISPFMETTHNLQFEIQLWLKTFLVWQEKAYYVKCLMKISKTASIELSGLAVRMQISNITIHWRQEVHPTKASSLQR